MLAPLAALAQQATEKAFYPLGFLAEAPQRGSFIGGLSGDGSTVVGASYDSAGRGQAFRWTGGVMTGLGFLPDSGPAASSFANGASADGSVIVGGSLNAAGFGEAFRWRNGAMTGLGVLSTETLSPYSWPAAVSANGEVVVGSSADRNGSEQAFRWSNGVITGLGFIDGGGDNPFARRSATTGVSANGSVVIGDSTDAKGHRQAFRWENGVLRPLGFLSETAPEVFSFAVAITPDGSTIAGSSYNADGNIEPFRWRNGVMTGLGFATARAPRIFSSANAISADGTTVVGNANDERGQSQAFRWKDGVMAGLGYLGGNGERFSIASAVSANGSIVVGVSSTATRPLDVFRWTEKTKMQSLSALLAAAGVALRNFETLSGDLTNYQSPFLSADGQFIAGTGTNRAGVRQAWLARYSDGVAGITDQSSLAASADQIGRARGVAMAQQHGLMPLLLDDSARIDGSSHVSAFGVMGSAAAGSTFRRTFESGLSFAGGLAGANENYPGVRVTNGVLAAASIRYIGAATAESKFYVDFGGWLSQADYRFTRTYMNGAGIATGVGSASGTQSYLFGRIGLLHRLTANDDVSISAEFGRQTFRTGGYIEPESSDNPFNAQIKSARNAANLGKVRLHWTHSFTPSVDATVWVAAARAFGPPDTLSVNIAGVGSFTPLSFQGRAWAEFGGRLGVRLNDSTSLELVASGLSGRNVATRLHAGGGLRVSF